VHSLIYFGSKVQTSGAAELYATLLYATQLYATQLYATQLYATQLYAAQLYATQLYARVLLLLHIRETARCVVCTVTDVF